jgi:signal transduction histidine kinase
VISKIKVRCTTWVCPFLLLFYSHVASAQTPSFIHYSVTEGLPSSEVYDVHQDRNGFIWFATDNGVVRYDGNQMETFQVNEGLADPVVFGIVEDAKGRVWFRTFSGKISYYHNRRIYPYRFNDTLRQLCNIGFLYSLYIDSTDNVWFGSSYNIGKISPEGRVQKEGLVQGQLRLKQVENHLLVCHLGEAELTKWVTMAGKDFKIAMTDKTKTHPISCTFSFKGEYYFSLGATIFKIGKESVTPVFQAKDQIISVHNDANESLWIGYLHNGLQCYVDLNDKAPVHFPFLDSKSVTSVCRDSQNGHWVSTLEDGVYYVPELRFLQVDMPLHPKIRSVFADGSKTLIGDEAGLLTVLGPTGQLISQKKFRGSSILSISKDAKRQIWISTTSETYLLDSAFTHIKTLAEMSLSGVASDNRYTWAVSGLRIFKFDAYKETVFGSPFGEQRFINKIGSNLYLYGRLGLTVFTSSFRPVQVPKYLENLKISKVLNLDKSFLLITTLGSGFYVINKNDWSCQHYDSKTNFIADNVYSAIIVDSTLWLGTEKGLAATNLQRLIVNSPSFQFYTKRNGLSSNRIVHLSYSKPNVWAFYDNRFSLLPANLPYKKQDTPIFYLKDVLINNHVDSLENLSKLKFNQNNIQINFGFIDFKNQNILIRYRLSSSSNWNYDAERNIKFFSLSPGDYSFELEYSTDNFHWASAIKHPLKISPQWLMNWRIQLSLLLMLSLLGFLYYRRRIQLLREKQDLLKIINEQQQKLIRAELETLESERGRIAKDLHDSIGTNLAAIKLFLNSFFKKSNEPNASIIEETLQETIQGTKDIIANLAPADLERFGLVEAIRIYTQRIKDQFDIDIEVNALGEEVRQPEIGIHLFRVIQELISNSLKYANAKKITIRINFTSSSLKIIYEDDGVGFNINSIAKGNGLLNIQSRVQIMEGTIKFDSNNHGVSYRIIVPLKINQS